MKFMTIMAVALSSAVAFAQAPGGRDAFVQQQAYAEMQRVSGQIDVLQNNIDELAQRLSKLERASASDDTAALNSRIAALEASVAALRRELQQQRGEIVKDLSSRIAKMPQSQPQPSKPSQPKAAPVSKGPHREYVVAAGDNLWLIARAFNTSVGKIREMNNLRGDSLKVGQKLILPAEQEDSK
jgi:LysM repeat protein